MLFNLFNNKEQIIAHQRNNINKNPFYLHFLVGGDGTEWIDAGLPTPNYFYRLNSLMGETIESYCIAYLLDGFFTTQKSQEYLNDIIARFCLSLPIRERFSYLPEMQTKQHNYLYKLKAFQNLKSITQYSYRPKLRGQMLQDNTFWELKLWVEYNIKNNGGEGNCVAFELLLDHALLFYTFKDRSTAKAKCRNIWNWYESRGWTYHMLKKSTRPKKEILMTRQERARTNAAAKAEKARKAVINALTGLYADEYKKVNGKWHINKIAESIRLDKRTVSKYVREWEVKLK